ncbi:MAG TPA: DUF6691 family protein [Vicinamibacterales bacterium]|nr:DUF6691 family protein [Vicinamibacterales bacterium]
MDAAYEVERNRSVVGAAFGFVLGWARVTDHDVIRNMLLLREPDVFLIMMSAIATAALGVRALRALKARAIVDDSPVNWKVEPPAKRHIGGSVLFGLGWSIAATCPGPVAAQLGRGQFAGLWTVRRPFDRNTRVRPPAHTEHGSRGTEVRRRHRRRIVRFR